MPWLDWQFYVVTAVAAWGAWTLLRQLVGSREAGPPCGACASGTAACAKKPFPGAEASSKLVVLQDRRRQATS